MKKSGIAVELAEIEARNETYLETLGFLELIDSLTDVVIPQTLGAGLRVPGFDPYFQFLVNDVYLKFRTRAYQNPKEKVKNYSLLVEYISSLGYVILLENARKLVRGTDSGTGQSVRDIDR